MRRLLVGKLMFALFLILAVPQAKGVASRDISPPLQRTKVVILGVSHSAELVAETYQPAIFRAFFNRVKPQGICVERSPQEFARSDFYEFTYEAQFIAVPYARSHGIALYPIDWLPPAEDSVLAWGLPDIDAPAFVRNPNGFQGFINFDDPDVLKLGLFYSEAESDRMPGREWAEKPAPEARSDFARRLFLYRTYMQAMRIRAVAQKSKEATILVIVGSMHKDDLERILAGYPEIEIVQPSSFGVPTVEEIAREVEIEDLLAIASFNLLGTQAKTGNVDWAWMGKIVGRLEKEHASPETTLLKTRLAVLSKKLSAKDAIPAYRALEEVPAAERFTFTGIKDNRRLDSYFDPFGNLTIRQRAMVELAREYRKASQAEEAVQLLDGLLQDATLSEFQRAQLRVYWDDYVANTF